MRIASKHTLDEFTERHADAKASVEGWCAVAKASQWESVADVIAAFPNASKLSAERVRFEIAHNKYRLIVAFYFKAKIAYVKFIGTHAEYDKIDATTVDMF